jgi:enterochelin esterase family protein
VLYLMHGHNGTAADWTLTGNANFILDNAIAERRAVPMIVVMPYAHAVPIDAPSEEQARNVALFGRYLVEEVVPMVEGKYRVEVKAGSRSIAGLSMGGAESLQTGLSRMDLFGYVGIFSAGMPKEFAFPEGAVANEKLRLLWIGCGRQDGVFPSAKRLSDTLNAKKIRHTFFASEGAHTFTVWRLYLNEFAPLLFR